MSNTLSIEQLVLSRGQRSLPHPVDGHRSISFDVKITVKNTGAKPLHVIDQVRGMDYDPSLHRLTLRLCEPPPGKVEKDAPTFHLPAPRTTTVAAHGTATIVVRIPAILVSMRPGKDGFISEKTELKHMTSIRCEIGFSERPMTAGPREPLAQMRTRLIGWGQMVAKDTPVEPDTRETETDKKSVR